ncbi:hypothetical protein MKW98_011254 [Papaver atlanticum]|uniref:DNA-directed RNA polymerase subunit n=1 Tax=Papaver atlanticum TaxID=357466 RepID=A0AAD4SV60_9MAGN|nr:hypothetical protein MKW98_011254 [Papaver atlanticum]
MKLVIVFPQIIDFKVSFWGRFQQQESQKRFSHSAGKKYATASSPFRPKSTGRHGFVVVDNVEKGLTHDGAGFVTFPVNYQCVGFRPFKSEILEAVDTMVNKIGFSLKLLIQDDMEFQSGDIPNFTTSDGSVKIQKDSEVRLKIIGTRVDVTEIFCIDTMKDDFLGVTNDPGAAA